MKTIKQLLEKVAVITLGRRAPGTCSVYLLASDFLLCRLLPQGLEACDYHPSIDNFGQSNWVAAHKGMLNGHTFRLFNITLAKGLVGDRLADALPPQHPLLKRS